MILCSVGYTLKKYLYQGMTMQYGLIKGALVGAFLTMGTAVFAMQTDIKEAEHPKIHARTKTFWRVDNSDSRAAIVTPIVKTKNLAVFENRHLLDLYN